MTDPIQATEHDWKIVNSWGANGIPTQKCLLELRDRVAAMEAMAKTAAMVVHKTGPALLLPDDAFQAMEAAAARVAPATTADGLSPVEPAPQAPQGVTAEGLSPKEIEAQEAFIQMRDDVLSGVEGLDNYQINTVLDIIDNYTPEWVTAPPAPADSQSTHSQYFSSHHAIAGEVVKILEDAGLSAEPPAPEADAALSLAAIIRSVDGSHSLGAAALADAILSHPAAASVFQPPAPDHIPGATEMVGDGEREELAQWQEHFHEYAYELGRPDWGHMTTRTAALLRELETIAFAASDYLCAKKFHAFASEHGGLELLEANLSRLVAHFEHGPRPVPGVDVPGPDGDYGGIQELCNAEGVDVRIGAPLLRRALAAWRQPPAPVAAPVPVSERPWEQEGWCDAEGRCWWGRCADEFFSSEWTLATHADIEDFCEDAMPQFCLPHWAIPQPPPPTPTPEPPTDD